LRATLNPAAVAAILMLFCAPAGALTLDMPGPTRETASVILPLSSYALPTAAWDGTKVPSRLVEGRLERRAWRIDSPDRTTLELLAPLRAQLAAEGFTPVFECETKACGGFDFRFATEVLQEPDMHVDLGDFRFLSAEKEGEAVSLLVSRSTAAGFVQMTHVGPAATPVTVTEPPEVLPSTEGTPPDLQARLAETGMLALDDLRFDQGSTTLEPAKYPSLIALSGWLAENPARRIALVGHTDTVGGLDPNIAISRGRAQAVREVLVGSYGVAPTQLTAEGVGYLSPRATNLTEEGRARNRRVEAVVVATE
jgi:outer membrane protein OmpA-like peptidoglycan-associated protein